MRNSACFLTMVVVFLLLDGGSITAQSSSAKTNSLAECGSATVTAFAQTIKGILLRSEKTRENPLDGASKDADIRKLAANAKSAVSIVEGYLRCSPSATSSEVEIAVMILQCLPLDAYLGFVDHLSQVNKSEAAEWGLYYAVTPTFPWSSRLALKHANARVRSTLGRVGRSPNVTPELQRIVLEILDGTTRRSLTESPVKPLLQCGSR